MKYNKTFKVGDKIVRFGRVYIIFKIEKRKTQEKEERIILFKPYFETKDDRRLVVSIPIDNLDKTNIRGPITKKELGQLLKELSKESEADTLIDIYRAREELNLNDPYKNVEILKCLLNGQSGELADFSRSKQDIFALAIGRLVEEIALVGGFSLIEARNKITEALEMG